MCSVVVNLEKAQLIEWAASAKGVKELVCVGVPVGDCKEDTGWGTLPAVPKDQPLPCTKPLPSFPP